MSKLRSIGIPALTGGVMALACTPAALAQD
jgi:hypothetical protein